jgi:nucleotide-binding universal stress UspA family protein
MPTLDRLVSSNAVLERTIAMSITDTGSRNEVAANTGSSTPTAPLITIVGYDGTDTARQALHAATALIAGRDGQLEVIWVAHAPGLAAISPDAEVGMLEGFSAIEHDLGDDVRELIGQREQRWTFHRRDGAVAHELLAAADELRNEHGDHATIVIVVGASVHAYHQVMGSVPVSLARQARFPLLVVPVAQPAESEAAGS